MPDDRAAQFTVDALAQVDAFVAARPGYTRRGVAQSGQGATNRVVFARRLGEQVVFKVFCQAERKQRECFAMRHWEKTGLVPTLIWDANPVMILMSYVPGMYLHQAQEADGDTVWRAACRETGWAIGSLTRVPLSSADQRHFEAHFYGNLGPLEAYLGRILELGRSVQVRDPDFQGDFWRENLDFVEAHLEDILSEPRVLYHQDVSNLHVQRGRFVGFFDLEMCRVGCATMQLAASLGMLQGNESAWASFREGWEAATDQPLSVIDRRAAAAANYLLHWREICRYLSYDGTPGSGFDWASPADPIRYRNAIQATQRMLEVP